MSAALIWLADNNSNAKPTFEGSTEIYILHGCAYLMLKTPAVAKTLPFKPASTEGTYT